MFEESGRQTSLGIDLGGEQVVLERIEAVEALSAPFLITLDIISPLGEIELLPHLGKPAWVSVSQDDELQRYFHGLVTDGEFTKESGEGFHYRLSLRPWTYFLSHNRDFAIYQDQDVLQIIKSVLEEAGISDVDYTRLSKTWEKRTYCVQYDESDFGFISRLMEEEGIYYYFTHSDERHVLVLCDGPSSHSEGKPSTVHFNPTHSGSVVRGLRGKVRPSPGIFYPIVDRTRFDRRRSQGHRPRLRFRKAGSPARGRRRGERGSPAR